MRKFKKLLSCFLACLLVTSLSVNVYAADLAGDNTYNCNVEISFTLNTEKYQGEEIKVYFNDITNTVNQTVVLNTENSTAFQLLGPTTYNVVFEGVPEGCQINDVSTGLAVENKLAISAESKSLNWILENSTVQPDSPVIGEEKVYTVENEDAEKAYQTFLDKVSFIKTDDSWCGSKLSFLNQYGKDGINKKMYSEAYAKYVAGGSVEEYFALSPFDQFLWIETYVKLAENINSNWGFDFFFKNEETFKQNHTNYTLNTIIGNNDEVVKEAYLELMDWQYNYIKEKGVPFNFIRNRSYLEEIGQAPVEQEPEEQTPVIEDIPDQPDEPEEKGIWSDLMDNLAGDALIIVIALVLMAAGALLAYKRKIKNVDDEDY